MSRLTNTIKFEFDFKASDHEDQYRSILKQEIYNIISDNVCPRAGIEMDDIDYWMAEEGNATYHTAREGFRVNVSVRVHLKEIKEVSDIGEIKSRAGAC